MGVYPMLLACRGIYFGCTCFPQVFFRTFCRSNRVATGETDNMADDPSACSQLIEGTPAALPTLLPRHPRHSRIKDFSKISLASLNHLSTRLRIVIVAFFQNETLSPLEHVPRALLVSTVPAAATPAYARSLHLAVQQTFVYPIATLPHRAVNTRSQATGIVL